MEELVDKIELYRDISIGLIIIQVLTFLFVIGIFLKVSFLKSNIVSEITFLFKKYPDISNHTSNTNTANYCAHCNRIENDYQNGVCKRCGNHLTKI